MPNNGDRCRTVTLSAAHRRFAVPLNFAIAVPRTPCSGFLNRCSPCCPVSGSSVLSGISGISHKSQSVWCRDFPPSIEEFGGKSGGKNHARCIRTTTAQWSASRRRKAVGADRHFVAMQSLSAFGGKADMPFCAAHVCFDPKRTSRNPKTNSWRHEVWISRSPSPLTSRLCAALTICRKPSPAFFRRKTQASH